MGKTQDQEPGFEEAPCEQRRDMRIAVGAVPAEIILRSGRHVPAKLINVSSKGFLAECPAHVPKGGSVYLRIPKLNALLAEVRWAHADLFGCRFTPEPGRADLLAISLWCAQKAK